MSRLLANHMADIPYFYSLISVAVWAGGRVPLRAAEDRQILRMNGREKDETDSRITAGISSFSALTFGAAWAGGKMPFATVEDPQ